MKEKCGTSVWVLVRADGCVCVCVCSLCTDEGGRGPQSLRSVTHTRLSFSHSFRSESLTVTSDTHRNRTDTTCSCIHRAYSQSTTWWFCFFLAKLFMKPGQAFSHYLSALNVDYFSASQSQPGGQDENLLIFFSFLYFLFLLSCKILDSFTPSHLEYLIQMYFY